MILVGLRRVMQVQKIHFASGKLCDMTENKASKAELDAWKKKHMIEENLTNLKLYAKARKGKPMSNEHVVQTTCMALSVTSGKTQTYGMWMASNLYVREAIRYYKTLYEYHDGGSRGAAAPLPSFVGIGTSFEGPENRILALNQYRWNDTMALAKQYRRLNNFAVSEIYSRHLLEAAARVFGPTSMHTAGVLFELVMLYFAMRDNDGIFQVFAHFDRLFGNVEYKTVAADRLLSGVDNFVSLRRRLVMRKLHVRLDQHYAEDSAEAKAMTVQEVDALLAAWDECSAYKPNGGDWKNYIILAAQALLATRQFDRLIAFHKGERQKFRKAFAADVGGISGLDSHWFCTSSSMNLLRQADPIDAKSYRIIELQQKLHVLMSEPGQYFILTDMQRRSDGSNVSKSRPEFDRKAFGDHDATTVLDKIGSEIVHVPEYKQRLYEFDALIKAASGSLEFRLDFGGIENEREMIRLEFELDKFAAQSCPTMVSNLNQTRSTMAAAASKFEQEVLVEGKCMRKSGGQMEQTLLHSIRDAKTSAHKPHCAWSGCGKTDPDAGPSILRRCGACRTVMYCSVECSKSNWVHHKSACKAAQAATSPAATSPVAAQTTEHKGDSKS